MQPKKFLLQLLKIVVSLGLIIFLLIKISPGKLVPHLASLNPLFIAVSLVVFFVSSLLGAVQWYILIRTGGIELSFPRALKLYFVGLFFNNFLPANVGGDAVKIYDVVRVGNDPYQVFAITLLDRIIGITGLCLLAIAASVSLIPIGATENLVVFMLIFIGCIAPVLALILNRRLSRGVRKLFGMIKLWGLGERFNAIFEHLGSFRHLRTLLLRLLLLALVVQFLRVATHIFVGRALGIEVTSWNFVHFYVFIPLLGLIMVLPISINGLGVREGTGILLFTRIGFSEERALLMEFLTYVVMVVVSLIGGIIFLGRHLRRGPE
ncbi:MAG: flippase-like domain-containing protein [bacterium]|nr:MAG: flippase-like domain-containing protein [bacterium]